MAGRTFSAVPCGSVAGDGGVDGAGPGVDAAGEGLSALEALAAEPHCDGERALAVVAENDDVGVGVEFGVGTRGDVAHGHEEGIGQAGGLKLPGLADVEEDGRVRLRGGTELDEGLRGDLRIGRAGGRGGHGSRIPLERAVPIGGAGIRIAGKAHLTKYIQRGLAPGSMAN